MVAFPFRVIVWNERRIVCRAAKGRIKPLTVLSKRASFSIMANFDPYSLWCTNVTFSSEAREVCNVQVCTPHLWCVFVWVWEKGGSWIIVFIFIYLAVIIPLKHQYLLVVYTKQYKIYIRHSNKIRCENQVNLLLSPPQKKNAGIKSTVIKNIFSKTKWPDGIHVKIIFLGGPKQKEGFSRHRKQYNECAIPAAWWEYSPKILVGDNTKGKFFLLNIAPVILYAFADKQIVLRKSWRMLALYQRQCRL